MFNTMKDNEKKNKYEKGGLNIVDLYCYFQSLMTSVINCKRNYRKVLKKYLNRILKHFC